MIHMVSRSAWGALPPKAPYSAWSAGAPHGLIVHYVGGGGTLNLADHNRCAGAVRDIQRYEMSHGYLDIAYNVLVCPHGVFYEGRGWDHAGAANGPRTNRSIPSVCVLANVPDQLTPECADALRRLRADRGGEFLGHREVNATSCPGDPIFAWVVQERGQPPLVPVATPHPTPPAATPDGGLAALARALRDLGHTFAKGPTLRQGSSGQAVRELQLLIVALYGEKLVIDGQFGPATKAAVKRVQSFNKLGVDGIVGPATRARLASITRNTWP